MTPMHLTLNPAEIITGWTALIAVVSILNRLVLIPYLPTVGRVVSAIISIPAGHIGNFVEDLEQLIADANPPTDPPAAPPGPPVVVDAPPNPPPPPAAARGRIGLAVAFVGMLAFGGTQTACTPALNAERIQIENIVLGGLLSGESQKQIEEDVATAIGGKTGADIVILVDDALTLLIDSGKLTPAELTAAQTLLGQVHPTAMGHRALRDAK
jgi:hypothetical protein